VGEPATVVLETTPSEGLVATASEAPLYLARIWVTSEGPVVVEMVGAPVVDGAMVVVVCPGAPWVPVR